jgi:transposase InsO family protein
MPWKESDTVSERVKFVMRHEEGERVTDLAEEFGISRKTAHKILARYQELGMAGLVDRSRRPRRSPLKTPEAIATLIVRARRSHPTWGPRKLKGLLEERHRGVRIPAASTIAVILEDAGLVEGRKRRRRASPSVHPLQTSSKPNDIWSMDFKGQFRLGNGKLCYPLTVADHFSRMLLCCEALEDTKTEPARFTLEQLFKERGLPEWMRTDNGAPFASTGLAGLSKLSVWLMVLGVHVERIEPGHPEQNGRHERMHRDLKAETTRPAAQNLLQQQERFDNFSETFNGLRPHEALEMKRPADVYKASARAYSPPEPLNYPLHDHTVHVYGDGEIFLPMRGRPRFYVGSHFAGENVGLRSIADGTWLVTFMDLDLGYLDEETNKIIALPSETVTSGGHPQPKDPLGEEPFPQLPHPDSKNTKDKEPGDRA